MPSSCRDVAALPHQPPCKRPSSGQRARRVRREEQTTGLDAGRQRAPEEVAGSEKREFEWEGSTPLLPSVEQEWSEEVGPAGGRLLLGACKQSILRVRLRPSWRG